MQRCRYPLLVLALIPLLAGPLSSQTALPSDTESPITTLKLNVRTVLVDVVVTDKDGKYEIKGLPPGDYTIAFVQEKLGEQDQKVTLGAKDSKTVDATFKAQ